MTLKATINSRSIAGKLEESFRARQNEILMNIAEELAESSPVRTGRLVRNWQVQAEGAGIGTEKNEIPAGEIKSDARRSANATAMLQDFATDLATLSTRDIIQIVNPVPYAFFVETGAGRGGPQAPENVGFFQMAVDRAVRKSRR